LKNNQTSPSHATQETTFWVSPIPKTIHLSQSFKKKSFGKGWNYPILPSSPKKIPFEKEKEILTLDPLFLKLHLQLVILSI
jgi:hypothetical protein